MATLAPSLAALFAEVDARWPNRDHWSDGWLGDSRHSHLLSDHNPDEQGMVHAVDIDATVAKMTMGPGVVGQTVLDTLLGRCRDGRLDQIVHYLIYRGRIYSSTYGYAGRDYDGTNQHESHVHVSIHYTNAAENFAGPWGLLDEPKEWDELATKAEIREVIDNALTDALTSNNTALLNVIRVAIEAERGEDAAAVWDHKLTNAVTGEEQRAGTFLRYVPKRFAEILAAVKS